MTDPYAPPSGDQPPAYPVYAPTQPYGSAPPPAAPPLYGAPVPVGARNGLGVTALVRWAPGTYFSPHRHYGGEEIFVIDGVFEDEHGRYPAGSWLRSPHMSMHKPFSVEGCTILVKTGHLDVPDQTPQSQ